MEIQNKLLKGVIADADRLLETATANAKLSLEEEFTPAIKSMIARKLRAEAEVVETTEKAEELDELNTSGIGTADNKTSPEFKSSGIGTASNPGHEPSDEIKGGSADQKLDSSSIGTGDNKKPQENDSSDIGTKKDKKTMTSEEIVSETEVDEDLDEEMDLDLESIIRELENDLEDDEVSDEEDSEEEGEEDAEEGEEEEGAEDEAGEETGEDEGEEEDSGIEAGEEGEEGTAEKPVFPPSKDTEEGAPDLNMGAPSSAPEVPAVGNDKLDLEAIMAEIEAEEMAADEHFHQVSADRDRLKAELAEYRQAVEVLRGKLQEVNLLNAKLLYTNQLFRKEGLSTDQKINIVETFDRAKTVREVKLVYTTLAEHIVSKPKSVKQQKKVVTEGFASTATGAKSEPKVLEENSVVKRLQFLAGLTD